MNNQIFITPNFNRDPFTSHKLRPNVMLNECARAFTLFQNDIKKLTRILAIG
jgi:hypothetical protein